MTDLLIYRGLPASGKTTAARLWVDVDPVGRARVNRDDLRRMLHGRYVDGQTEQRVVAARDALIGGLLERGVSVACDDTNLSQRVVRDIAKIGRRAGADIFVHDLTYVPLEECIARDARRLPVIEFGDEKTEAGEYGYVGAEVIRGMYDRYLAGGRKLAPLEDEPEPEPEFVSLYVARPGTPRAIMVDLDGTLCLHDGRSPYDETLVATDLPNPSVVACVRAMDARGYRILYVSGRSSGCAEETLAWIHEHVGTLDGHEGLLMREQGDRRRDSVVKRELFDRHLRDRYDVAFVLDDRQQVVDAWREIGLTVFQVAPGDF